MIIRKAEEKDIPRILELLGQVMHPMPGVWIFTWMVKCWIWMCRISGAMMRL